jgi:hypothetical protein
MEGCVLDFKVFKGTTTGEAIYNDIVSVLAKFRQLSTIILDYLGVTDTTGSMGVLGKYCRENGRRHAYCVDHNFHRNAILAFNREFCLMFYSFCNLNPTFFISYFSLLQLKIILL